MRKFVYLTLLVVMLVTAACTNKNPEATPTAEPAATNDSSTTAVALQSGECELIGGIFPDFKDASAATYAPIMETEWVRGPQDATMTVIEYAEYTCPYCVQIAAGWEQLLSEYPDEVRYVYRHFPVGHEKSNIAIQAAEAAALQGKFWEMHNLLYDYTLWESWNSLSIADFKTWVTERAGEMGMDTARFAADLDSAVTLQKATDGYSAALAAGINGTPSVFILLDGKLMWVPADGFYATFANLQAVLELWKLEDRKFSACPTVTVDDAKTYYATLETTKGDIKLELFADAAPFAVSSFIYLAENGWYDNVPWHRVIDNFVAQTGDPSGTGMGSPGYMFGDEITTGLVFDSAGVVGMANSGPGTNGSQFFITLAPQPDLNGNYTIFARVVQGMDVVQSLTLRNPGQDTVLADPDILLTVTITSE